MYSPQRCVSNALLILLMATTLLSGPAAAQTASADWKSEGIQACQAMMAAQNLGTEGARQRHYAAVAGVDSAALCQCVGPSFAQGMAAQPQPDAERQLVRSVASCLPHLGSLPSTMQNAILAGPQAAQPLSPAQQKAETQWCRDMAQGHRTAPGFDALYVRTWEQASGLKAADLCGACVVADMEDESAAARGEGQVWDQRQREVMLARALHNCQHWTYRMQVRIQE